MNIQENPDTLRPKKERERKKQKERERKKQILLLRARINRPRS